MPGTSASLVQKVGKFRHDLRGSRSGLNISAVTRPCPRLAVTMSGMSPAAATTRPSRTVQVATGKSASSKAGSACESANGFSTDTPGRMDLPAVDPRFGFPTPYCLDAPGRLGLGNCCDG